MVTLWNSIKVKKTSNIEKGKVLRAIDKVKQPNNILSSREQKNNYIYSLCSKNNYKDLPLKIVMKEDMSQWYGVVSYNENWYYNSNKISVDKWKKYIGQIEKLDTHDDGKLAVAFVPERWEAFIKMFTDRFDIITDEKTIWNLWVIEDTPITIVNIEWEKEMKGMWWFIKSAEDDKVCGFLNLRGQRFFLEKGNEIRLENTYYNITL